MSGKVPSAYLTAYGRIPKYLEAIQQGTAPTKFTTDYLEALGFKAKNDRALIPLLKEVRLLDEQNRPTPAYREFLDPAIGKVVLGRQVLAAYEGLFELVKDAHKKPASELEGKFKTLRNATDAVASVMAQTFLNLCKVADIDGARSSPSKTDAEAETEHKPVKPEGRERPPSDSPGFHYHIEIHLPNTTDPEVFRAIFKALREHLEVSA